MYRSVAQVNYFYKWKKKKKRKEKCCFFSKGDFDLIFIHFNIDSLRSPAPVEHIIYTIYIILYSRHLSLPRPSCIS